MIDPRGFEHFAAAFVFTQLIEVPLYMRLSRVRARAAFGLSLVTHPIVWFAIPALWAHLYLGAVVPLVGPLEPLPYSLGYGLIAETFAIVAEGGLLRACGVRRPWRTALLVNGISVLIGTITNALTGWP